MTETTINQGETITTEQQIGSFLQEHNEIEMVLPVVIGLFVTSRFQLRGANALLTNLVIASVARQVFMEIKKNAPESAQTTPQTNNNNPTAINLGGYSLVHSVPGRVRLRIPRLVNDPPFAERLQDLLCADEQVITVRINQAAAGVVINYDDGGLSELELGWRLMNIINSADSEPQVAAPD